MRALLIDDEQLVLDGLAAYLQVSLPELSLDKTADLDVALQLASTVRYAVILLDWYLVDADGQRIDGQGVIEVLRRGAGGGPILMVSGDQPEACARRVFEHGLAGYVPKSASGTVLVEAIRTALAGGVFLPDAAACQRAQATAPKRAVAAPATGVLLPTPGSPTELRQRFPALTERQADVFSVMVSGASDKQIARALGVSHHTVRTHVRGILAAVEVGRRGEAVFKAVGDADRG